MADKLLAFEDLRVGDLVLTAEGKAQPILWHGSRLVSAERLAAAPHLRPIRLRAAAQGGARRRVLKLSPQHGVYLARARAMVRAAHMGAFSRQAHVITADRDVIYCHILLPVHSLIVAEGWIVESLYPGPMALAGLTAGDRFAMGAALGVIGDAVSPMDLSAHYGPRVVPLLSRKMAQLWLTGPHFVQDNGITLVGIDRCLADFRP